MTQPDPWGPSPRPWRLDPADGIVDAEGQPIATGTDTGYAVFGEADAALIVEAVNRANEVRTFHAAATQLARIIEASDLPATTGPHVGIGAMFERNRNRS